MPSAAIVLWGLWAYTALLSSALHPAQALTGAVLAVAVLVVVRFAVRRVPLGGCGHRRSTSVRHRARRLRLPRSIDPDAAGRPRPRAPGAALPAA